VIAWCAGLPLNGEVRLSRQDQSDIAGIGRRTVLGGAILAMAIAVAAFVCIPMPTWIHAKYFPNTTGNTDIAITVMLILLFLILIPASLFTDRSPLQRDRRILKDGADGHALMFAGRVHTLNVDDVLIKKLGQAIDNDLVLCMLPRSELLWSANWIRLRNPFVVSVNEAAEPVELRGEYWKRSAEPDRLTRSLTEEEKAEVVRSARELRNSSLWHVALPIAVYVFSVRQLVATNAAYYHLIGIVGLLVHLRRMTRFTNELAKSSEVTADVAPAFPSSDSALCDPERGSDVVAPNVWRDRYLVVEKMTNGSTFRVNGVGWNWMERQRGKADISRPLHRG